MHFSFYSFDLFEIFRNENVLLRFLLKTEKVKFSSPLPSVPICLRFLKWHGQSHATKTQSTKARGWWLFLGLLWLLLPIAAHLGFFILNSRCFGWSSLRRLFLLWDSVSLSLLGFYWENISLIVMAMLIFSLQYTRIVIF